ncbi:MAG TPA: DUF924 family protein [Kofleriaceae bacterium]|nr:DUF924 family protein [Kofleriaceae bacterium]
MGDPRIDDVISFWFGAAGDSPETRMQRWFRPDPAFDASIRTRFGALLDEAAAGKLTGWPATPRGALALILVLDQFPRNVFRGTAGAFAYDARALDAARGALAEGHDRELGYLERMFLLLPFEHAEDRETQRESVAHYEALHAEAKAAAAPAGEIATLAAALDYAHRHKAIIDRFGRYPHRNALLERTSTGEEVDFLQEPGSSF